MFKPNRLIYENKVQNSTEKVQNPFEIKAEQTTCDGKKCEAKINEAEIPIGEVCLDAANQFKLKMETKNREVKTKEGNTEKETVYTYKTTDGKPVLVLVYNQDKNQYTAQNDKKVLLITNNLENLAIQLLPKLLEEQVAALPQEIASR